MLKRISGKLAIVLLVAGHIGLTLAQADRHVKIGVLNDQSGPYSATGGPGSVAAAKLAIEDIGGSIFGNPVQIVVGDHLHKPDVGSALARRWFDTEGVGAIFDIYNSSVTLAVQKIAQEKDKIVAVTMAGSRDISGKYCSPNGFQWGNDGYEAANLMVKGNTSAKPNSWYFLTVDYAAGHSLEKDARQMLEGIGGSFVGSSRFPLGTSDFSSFLLQAQASKAKNIALIGGGSDMTNSIKQAGEFGIQKDGQRFVPASMTTDDVFALGNKATAGMPLVLSFYWDENAATKAWTERFKKATGKMPTDVQANVYSAVLHYLKSVKAAGTTNTKAVLAKMKATPVNDFFTSAARIRDDGRLMRSIYYAIDKAPEQMKDSNDLLTLAKKFSGEEAFIPASMSECPALKK